MTAEEPRPAELARRVDDVRDEVRALARSLNERLDKVPTTDLLTAYLAKTDAEVAEMKRQAQEAKDEGARRDAELRVEIQERDAKLREEIAIGQARAQEAKRWALSASIAVGGLVVSVVGLLQQGGFS